MRRHALHPSFHNLARDRRGLALPAAIFGMLMLSLLGAAIWTAIDVSAKSAGNRWESAAALQFAEAGAAHALGILRNELADTSYTRLLLGSDNLPLTADDGRITGYGLPSDRRIPATGAEVGTGTYTVLLIDDPADMSPLPDALPLVDTNEKIVMRCTGTTSRGGSATIDALVTKVASGGLNLTAVVIDGPFTISGNPNVLGTCGGVYANSILVVSGTLTVADSVQSADEVTVSGSIEDPDGDPVTPLEDQPPVAVPDYNNPTATHCGTADYVLQADGWVKQNSTGLLFDATSSAKFNWKRSSSGPVVWETASDVTTWPGTFCVFGNVKIGNNMGESTGIPFAMSIIASGSIEISGNPLLKAEDPSGILLMAKGDVKISGNPVGGAQNYDGLIYARDQCEISGNPRVKAQLICKNQSSGGGSMNLVSENKISGDVDLTYDCNSIAATSGTLVRRVVSWSQRFN
jgi:hypothetical protein